MAIEKSSVDIDDIDDFRGFCRQATDDQLREIYRRERAAGRKDYAKVAAWVAADRGISL